MGAGVAAATKLTKVDFFWLRVISPLSWPIWMRRLFLITLPLSVPIALLIMAVLLIAMLCIRIFEPISQFWTAPQRRVRTGDYYSYHFDEKRRQDRIDAAAEQDELPLGK